MVVPRGLDTVSRRPGRFTSNHLHRLFPPNVQVITADKTEGSLNSALQTRGKILRGYFPAYHSEHLPFDDRRHSRTTRVNRGALAPGCFTAGITNSVARMSQSTNSLTTEFAAAAPLTTLAAPRNLLEPLAVVGRSPKLHPTVLPLVEELPPSMTLPPTERLPSAERPPPTDAC